MEFKIHSNCICCGNHDLRKLTRYSKDYLVKCKSCGLVFSERIPLASELEDYYKDYAYLFNAISPITIKRYNQLLDYLECYRENNKILDVGCGNGYFLLEAQKRGWEVYGTEFSVKSVEMLNLKGVNAKIGKLDANNYDKGIFDVITSFEVLEHIFDPKEEIGRFHELLRKGGLLYATTPNFNAISRYILREKWSIINYPEHLTFFNSRSINKLLVNVGFDKKRISTTGISINRFLIKKNTVFQVNKETNNTVVPVSKDEQLRESLEKKGVLRYVVSFINRVLNLLKMGDTIKVYYEKK